MTEIVWLAAACTAAGMAVGFAIGLGLCRLRRRKRPTSTADSFLRLLKH
ncbi:MAG: hypothetical protein IJW62_02990 [Clostridia bacterium]|nr:hypothetical protein [Clostridia bacterium]